MAINIHSTYGVLEPDFLRLAWILAGRHAAASTCADGLTIGEIRDRAPVESPRQLIFYKLRTRIAVAVAYATATRLLGTSGCIRPLSVPSYREPSDPMFSFVTSVSALSLGPFPSPPSA